MRAYVCVFVCACVSAVCQMHMTTISDMLCNCLQVKYIIEEATSPDNLCQLYEGWTPWV